MRAGCGRVVSSLANGGDSGGEGVSVKEGFSLIAVKTPSTIYLPRLSSAPISPVGGVAFALMLAAGDVLAGGDT
jgi:hypothetical protein